MIYDIKTKNRSFLKMALMLKGLGVKNNKFFLTLLHEDLAEVDPFSENLSEEQKIHIFDEISRNKWYFLREVVRLPVEGELKGIRYAVNLGNLTMSYLKSKNINQIVLLPRQNGKTWCEICDDIWNMLFACTNTNILYMNKEFKDSKDGLRKFKIAKTLLPHWLLEICENHYDKDNEEFKEIANRHNTLRAMPAATNTDTADKLGRGLTTALLYFDEFS